MLRQVRPAIVCLSLFTLLFGVAYPSLITGIAQLAMPERANGSLVVRDGAVRGSRLIGQPFDAPKYFWSRPSATLDEKGNALPYNAASSQGANLGPTNPALVSAFKDRIATLRSADPDATGPIPVDLVTSSASGLDPDLSAAGVLFQVHRVAAVRHLDEERVRKLVAEHMKGPLLGVLGEAVVNVVELNLALDDLR